ncbi:MAG: DUF1211 domain-containing protein [Anaerolineales bacterium]|nr:DUF1211 domain-containing protein [Anaerolineales bacterium]
MSKSRLEAFSDGVIAIIITIMVLELKIPHEGNLAALQPLIPKFLSYILSFVFLGIYWNNHHHLCQVINHVNGTVLWANLHLLFWLSLIPFATGWMGENNFSTVPVALYGFVLWMCGLAYYILVQALIKLHDTTSILVQAVGNKRKEMASLYIYTAAIPLAFVASWASTILYAVVAIMWLAPDRRIEDKIAKSDSKHIN